MYYLNHADKSTTWTKPVTPRCAPSMASSQAMVTTRENMGHGHFRGVAAIPQFALSCFCVGLHVFSLIF